MKRCGLIWVLIIALSLVGTLTLFGCTEEDPSSQLPQGDPLAYEPPEPQHREVTLLAVGDVMAHMPQVNQAFDASQNDYDFSPSFAAIKPYIEEADLAAANLETTLAGDARPYGGYPMFNTPDAMADALAGAGFDLICTANNHSLDTGEKGVYRTLEVLESRGLKTFGTARSQSERDRPLFVEADGIHLAFLAYTYGTNGIPLPQGKDFIVNLIDEDLMEQDIQRARAAGADLVLVYMHWGQEYQTQHSEQQEKWARVLAEAGADAVIGSHPHVVQPAQWITVDGEDGSDRQVPVVYSLGNFVSNQHQTGGIPTGDVQYGMLLRLHLEKDMKSGEAEVAEADYLLSYVQREQRHRIVPLHAALDDPSAYNVSGAARQQLLDGWNRHVQRLDALDPAYTPE